RYQYTERLANRIINASEGQPTRVGQYRHSRPTLVFYLRRPIETISNQKSLANFFDGNQRALLVTTSQAYPEVRPNVPADVVVLGEELQFPKRGKVLLLGRANCTGDRTASIRR